MEVILRGEPKEIAALVVAKQERREADETAGASDQEQLIREYERRLVLLKSGASPGNVIDNV